MNLNKALIHLLNGSKIKLPEWEGYWCIRPYTVDTGLIEVHLASGDVVYTPDFAQYGGREDWEVMVE